MITHYAASRLWQAVRRFISSIFGASNAHPRLPSNARETVVPGVVPQDRSIRVFISSTFRDMQEERDVLMKFVFPQLRKLCEERGVTFTEVDLRWGITGAQSQRGEVLPICLAEIGTAAVFHRALGRTLRLGASAASAGMVAPERNQRGRLAASLA